MEIALAILVTAIVVAFVFSKLNAGIRSEEECAERIQNEYLAKRKPIDLGSARLMLRNGVALLNDLNEAQGSPVHISLRHARELTVSALLNSLDSGMPHREALAALYFEFKSASGESRMPNPDEVARQLEHIQSLMSRFEAYGVQPKASIVTLLNRDLKLGIPERLRDPESRTWPLPDHSMLAVSFSCNDPASPNLVNGFSILGFDSLDNCMVNGSTSNLGSSYTWSISSPGAMREVPPLSKAVQNAFWSIPGYEEIGSGRYRFLSRRVSATD
jgi:hypothetical protein